MRPSLSSKPATRSSFGLKKKSSSPKRRVVFVQARDTVREYQAVDQNDVELLEALWQQEWEMDECKQLVRVRAKQWRRTGMGNLLNNTYLCDNDLTPALCQQQLNTLAQLPDEFHMRGVERHLSRKHDQDRTYRKRTIVQEVVYQFDTLQHQVENGNLTAAEAHEFLGQFSRGLNKEAALFARRMGKADEVVMRKGSAKSIEPAMELLEYLDNLEGEQSRNKGGAGRGQLKAAAPSSALSGRRLQARQA